MSDAILSKIMFFSASAMIGSFVVMLAFFGAWSIKNDGLFPGIFLILGAVLLGAFVSAAAVKIWRCEFRNRS